MNISESMMSHEQFIYIIAKIIANTDKHPSCQKLLLSGMHLIGKDDLMHGLDDIRKSLEMLLKDLLHNNKSLERQDDKKINKILEANGWNHNIQTLWPMIKDYFKRYQNAFVKHDDGERITEKDTDLCFKQALLLIMSLVCKKVINKTLIKNTL